jgi:hypothetical protein
MQYVLRFLVVTMPLLAACVDIPDEARTGSSVVTTNRITANRITANRITANRIAANRIAANRIAANRIVGNRITVSDEASELIATGEGRELFTVLVNCALPGDITLVATVDSIEYSFPGELGLAREWLHRSLDRKGQGWVSACVFAKVNEVTHEISIRGYHPALATDQVERVEFSLEEGAFYGNMFTPPDQPLVWIACRGADQAAGESGGLVGRDCAEEDPSNPGLTVCGFTFAGDCGDFTGEAACERFLEHGEFYQRCQAEPIDDHHHRRGARQNENDQIFDQVITTYVSP